MGRPNNEACALMVLARSIRKPLMEALKRDEGFRSKAYWDIDHYSIGYGTPAAHPDDEITQEEAEIQMDLHMQGAILEYYRLFKDCDINDIRACAIVNMIYNMGLTRFMGFKKMIAAIRAGNWERAAEEAKDSKWYTQVGKRAKRIVKALYNKEE